MTPMFLPLGLKVLVHQHERRQEDEFDSDNQAQERKRIRIKRREVSQNLDVQHDPDCQEHHMGCNEPKAPEEACDPVPDLLHP